MAPNDGERKAGSSRTNAAVSIARRPRAAPRERYSNVIVRTANGDRGWTREIERARLGY